MDFDAKELSISLEDSEEVISSLLKALEEHKVKQCSFASVSGKITDFDLRVFQGGMFQKKHFDEPYKIVTIAGNVKLKQGSGYVVHLILGGANLSNTKQVSGELEKGYTSGELTIRAKITEIL